MADKTISALTGATTPLAGTEVLPVVQSSTTKKVAVNDLTVKNVRSNATTGILQIAGPAVGTTRIMTTPDANFTAARTDAAQTFTGTQTFSSDALVNTMTVGRGAGTGTNNVALGQNALTNATTGSYNMALGDFVMATGNRDNTIGIGFQSGYASTSSGATFIGVVSGFNSTGARNIFIGYNSGNEVTSGAYNTIIGSYDGNDAVLDIRTASSHAVISDGAGAIKAYGDASNNWIVPSGNVKLGTAGKGIDFSATAGTGTSELLADYEEGTWTPRIEGATTPGTTTYTTQSGSYTKVGRLVTCAFTVQWSATTATGNLKIFGLPFTNATPNGDGLFFISNGTVTVSNGYVGTVQSGGTFIFVYSNVSASDYVSCTIQYFA